MSTLKRGPRDREASAIPIDAAARARAAAALADGNDLYLPFGPQVAMARSGPGGAILLALFPKEFPSVGEPALVLEDLPAGDPAGFGALGRVWLGSSRGLKRYELHAFDADGQGQLKRALAALRVDLTAQLTYRGAEESAATSRQAEAGLRRLSKALARASSSHGELLQAIADLADRFSPQAGEKGERLAALTRTAPEPSAAPATPPTPPPTAVAAGAAPK
jgi:hypothetical protein